MKLHIENMTCGGCARSVTKAITLLDDGARVEAALQEKFGIEHATVGIDWTGTESCSLSKPAPPSGHIGHDH